MRKQQEETIIWHLYPEEKPNKENIYLVQWDDIVDDCGEIVSGVMGSETFIGKYFVHDIGVIAWAEMPKGYK